LRVHRLLLVLATAASALFLAAPATAAPSAEPSATTSTDPYPDRTPDTAVDKPAVVAGNPVIFSGTGFWPHEVVNIEVAYTNTTASLNESTTGHFTTAYLPVPEVVVASPTTDANGSFSVAVELSQAGTAVLTAMGVQSGHVLNQTVTVTAAPAAAPTTTSSTQLAVTGLNPRVGAEVIGGASAITVGAFMVWLAFRARRRGTFEA
jgi:hypothetical protein